MNFLIVGIGGFFGAISRYAVGLAVIKHMPSSFPYATLIVNVSGSLLLGLVTALTARGTFTGQLALLAGVGFLGAYTTFSTFAVDIIYLFKAQQYFFCALNVVINPVLSVSAALIGMRVFTS